jgi:hypothetical protein
MNDASAPTPTPRRPLSVRIGRIVVRLIPIGLILWGAFSGYGAYQRKKRAQTIAPIHAYALQVMVRLKQGDYFAAQAQLDPHLQHSISVDQIAYFAQRCELNTTRTGTWGEWNTTREANATLFHLDGTLRYTDEHNRSMRWIIKQTPTQLHLEYLEIGSQRLIPDPSPVRETTPSAP